LQSLQTPQGRSRTGLYLIEGIRHVARAVEDGAPIQSLFVCPPILNNPFGQKLARRMRQLGIACETLSPDCYRALTLAHEPQGIGAVIKQQWTPIHAVHPEPASLWLAVESIDSPGNLGTMIRTAEAAGAAGVFVLDGAVEPYDPAAVRATMGSLFTMKFARCSTAEFISWAKRAGVAIAGSSPAGLLEYRGFPFRLPAALVIGSEKHGLSERLAEACDFVVRIPMMGRCDSINAAVAAGVLLYELFDRRRTIRVADRL
jgi:TrmH family RNA methyltransferase